MQNYNQAFMSAAALGVNITVAAGDNGSSDGQSDGKACGFSSEQPLGFGSWGHQAYKNKETVWNDGDGWATGGGISDVFPVPDYQKIKLPASVNSKQHKGERYA